MPKKPSRRTNESVLSKHETAIELVLGIVKGLDSQNQTIIHHLSVLGSSLDEIQKLVESTIGERIEKLRRDVRQAIAAILPSPDAAPIDGEIRAMLLNKPGATQ